jgi:Kef-type K+ transport system membrane component KefB
MHTNDVPVLLIFGALFLLGLGADLLGRRSAIPRVTLLILAGLAVGPIGFDLLPRDLVETWFPPLTTLALSLVGFLLGEKLSISALKAHGRAAVAITLGETTATLVAVLLALLALGVHPVPAILLAGIATASAPTATFDVVHEARAHGEFADTLLAVVALDDAVALLLFSCCLAAASAVAGEHSLVSSIGAGAQEIGGSLLLGAVLGVPMAYLSGRIRPGEPTLAEAMGFVLLCGGVATWLDLSPVLSSMTMGAMVASLAKHHERPFHAIEGVEWPFLILFFVFAGASAHADALLLVGGITAVYMLFRCAGTYAGAWLGAYLAETDATTRRWIGLCLYPQAGVSIGMALLAAQRFPAFEPWLLPTVLASTVIYEVLTPALTRRALRATRPARARRAG